MTPREPSRDLQSDKINQVRPELNKRTPEQVKADEAAARKAVSRGARDEGDKVSLLGQIFGRGK
jgi:hypothetical protein